MEFLFSHVARSGDRAAHVAARKTFNKPNVTAILPIDALRASRKGGVAYHSRAAYRRAVILAARKACGRNLTDSESEFFGAGGMPSNIGRA